VALYAEISWDFMIGFLWFDWVVCLCNQYSWASPRIHP
jgi:hypothetical protein